MNGTNGMNGDIPRETDRLIEGQTPGSNDYALSVVQHGRQAVIAEENAESPGSGSMRSRGSKSGIQRYNREKLQPIGVLGKSFVGRCHQYKMTFW